MKVRMKSLGIKPKPYSPSKVAEVMSPKPQLVRYPEVTLNSAQISDLEDIVAGEKCCLTFEAEVKGYKTPDEYDINYQGVKPNDLIVTFKLLKGSYAEIENTSINEAAHAARKEKYE